MESIIASIIIISIFLILFTFHKSAYLYENIKTRDGNTILDTMVSHKLDEEGFEQDIDKTPITIESLGKQASFIVNEKSGKSMDDNGRLNTAVKKALYERFGVKEESDEKFNNKEGLYIPKKKSYVVSKRDNYYEYTESIDADILLYRKTINSIKPTNTTSDKYTLNDLVNISKSVGFSLPYYNGTIDDCLQTLDYKIPSSDITFSDMGRGLISYPSYDEYFQSYRTMIDNLSVNDVGMELYMNIKNLINQKNSGTFEDYKNAASQLSTVLSISLIFNSNPLQENKNNALFYTQVNKLGLLPQIPNTPNVKLLSYFDDTIKTALDKKYSKSIIDITAEDEKVFYDMSNISDEYMYMSYANSFITSDCSYYIRNFLSGDYMSGALMEKTPCRWTIIANGDKIILSYLDSKPEYPSTIYPMKTLYRSDKNINKRNAETIMYDFKYKMYMQRMNNSTKDVTETVGNHLFESDGIDLGHLYINNIGMGSSLPVNYTSAPTVARMYTKSINEVIGGYTTNTYNTQLSVYANSAEWVCKRMSPCLWTDEIPKYSYVYSYNHNYLNGTANMYDSLSKTVRSNCYMLYNADYSKQLVINRFGKLEMFQPRIDIFTAWEATRSITKQVDNVPIQNMYSVAKEFNTPLTIVLEDMVNPITIPYASDIINNMIYTLFQYDTDFILCISCFNFVSLKEDVMQYFNWDFIKYVYTYTLKDADAPTITIGDINMEPLITKYGDVVTFPYKSSNKFKYILFLQWMLKTKFPTFIDTLYNSTYGSIWVFEQTLII